MSTSLIFDIVKKEMKVRYNIRNRNFHQAEKTISIGNSTSLING